MSKNLLAELDKNGYIVFKNFFSKNELKDTQKTICSVFKTQTQTQTIKNKRELDAAALALASKNRSTFINIYDTGCRSFALYKLATSKKIENLVNLLKPGILKANSLSAVSMRINLPNEDDKLLDWHQDYPFIQDSTCSLVFWFPIFNSPKNGGGVRLIKGSHKNGIIKVKDRMDQSGNWFLDLENLSKFNLAKSTNPQLKEGDLLVMSTLLLHKSEPNRSKHVRWTGQFRVGNFLHPFTVSKEWPRGYHGGEMFMKKHKEYTFE